MICFVFLIASLFNFAISVNLLNALFIPVMCSNPIRIKNPKITKDSVISFNARYDKEFLEVPCGSCPDCQSMKLMEWRSRAWAEHESAKHDGGFTAFLTFTYNDEHLPTYKGVPCFCKSDVQKLMKNLRRRLNDELRHDVFFRYLAVCEYGEADDCTHRPHYHVEFFLHEFVPDDVFFMCAWCAWSEKPKKSIKTWKSLPSSKGSKIRGTKRDIDMYIDSGLRGMVQLGKNKDGNYDLHVNDVFGTNYVTKYITKDFHFFNQKNRLFYNYVVSRLPYLGNNSEIKLNSEFVKNNPSLYLLQKEFCDVFKIYDTFHLQSIGFGSYLMEQLSEFQIANSTFSMPDPKNNDKDVPLPLPQYICRKLYYDTKYCYKGLTCSYSCKDCRFTQPCYVLKNPLPSRCLGLSVRPDKQPYYKTSSFGAYKKAAMLDNIVRKKCDEFYQLWLLPFTEEFHKLYFSDYDSIEDVKSEFYCLLNGRPLYRLFEYQLIFRNRNIVRFETLRETGLLKSPVNHRSLTWYYLLFNHPIYQKFDVVEISTVKYNDFALFKDFDDCLLIIQKLKKFKSYLKHKNNIELNNTRQKVDTYFGKYLHPRLKPIVKLSNF